jgi:uncharacterized phiE125 gp8 family phage protein
LTLAAAKRHLWQVGADADDEYINELIDSAINYVEEHTHRSLVERQCTISIDRFPIYMTSLNNLVAGYVGILIPINPVQSIVRIDYTDTNGNNATIPATNLQLQAFDGRTVVYPAPNFPWPFNNPLRFANVTIVVNAGWPVNQCPPYIRHLLRALVALWYDKRIAATSALQQEIPHGISALLRQATWWW